MILFMPFTSTLSMNINMKFYNQLVNIGKKNVVSIINWSCIYGLVDFIPLPEPEHLLSPNRTPGSVDLHFYASHSLYIPKSSYIQQTLHNYWSEVSQVPITVVARSKAQTVFARLNIGWDLGFQSHSSHGCPCAFILCLCSSVCR
jgi:hypothetical protein